MSELEFLVAHPQKHHVYHLAAGIAASGRSMRLLVPFYRSGLAELLAYVPGPFGRRVRGYRYSRLRPEDVLSPIRWQVNRLLSFKRLNAAFEDEFDRFVAAEIERASLAPRVLVTLQDYMPRTVQAAKARGIVIWSDQISNRSDTARRRIREHALAVGADHKEAERDSINDRVLASADVVTVPSKYAADGLAGRLRSESTVFTVPYGVDRKRFVPLERVETGRIGVLARANTLKKGGHLLIGALRILAREGSFHKPIEVTIMGVPDETVRGMLGPRLGGQITVSCCPVPHADVPKLMSSVDLFVMPSLSESMSLACVEAMQMALPLVITPFCGIDAFVHGVHGVEVLDDVQSVAGGLAEALSHPDRRKAWGSAARNAAEALNWDQYEAHISELAAKL